MWITRVNFIRGVLLDLENYIILHMIHMLKYISTCLLAQTINSVNFVNNEGPCNGMEITVWLKRKPGEIKDFLTAFGVNL